MGHIEANSRAEGQEDSRRRTISFSSEEPYRRWFGMEILDHAENALDLSRLNDVGVLLFTGGAAALMAAGIYVGWLHPII